jgi:hypothetical protein
MTNLKIESITKTTVYYLGTQEFSFLHQNSNPLTRNELLNLCRRQADSISFDRNGQSLREISIVFLVPNMKENVIDILNNESTHKEFIFSLSEPVFREISLLFKKYEVHTLNWEDDKKMKF